MLTGRPVNPLRGGHGVGWRPTPASTVHAAAGHYVNSVYDLVHDYGYTTSFLAHGNDLGIVDSSWGPGDGSVDRYGTNNGRDKISQYALLRTDGKVVRTLAEQLAGGAPTLAYAHLARPASIGQRYGWRSPEYAAAVSQVSALVGRIQQTIDVTPSLAGTTLLVVTADSGERRYPGVRPDEAGRDYRIPFFATGPSVPPATDLYALNPQLTDPGSAPGAVRRSAAGAQRVRRQPGDHRPGHAPGARQHAGLRSDVHGLRAVALVSGP